MCRRDRRPLTGASNDTVAPRCRGPRGSGYGTVIQSFDIDPWGVHVDHAHVRPVSRKPKSKTLTRPVARCTTRISNTRQLTDTHYPPHGRGAPRSPPPTCHMTTTQINVVRGRQMMATALIARRAATLFLSPSPQPLAAAPKIMNLESQRLPSSHPAPHATYRSTGQRGISS